MLVLDPWLDWCASRFKLRTPGDEPNVELDVRVGGKSHVITVPEYVADGLCGGTGEQGPYMAISDGHDIICRTSANSARALLHGRSIWSLRLQRLQSWLLHG
jgi:hypothetical protein